MQPGTTVLGIFIFLFFIFLMRKIPSYRDSNSRPNVSESYEVTNWATEATGFVSMYVNMYV